MANRKVGKTRRNRRLSRSRSRRMKGGACPPGKNPCGPCGGRGTVTMEQGKQCSDCKGTGRDQYPPVVNGKPVNRQCGKCGGKGTVVVTLTKPCFACGGSGCR
jgi:DnaJ-class molecular chaperone